MKQPIDAFLLAGADVFEAKGHPWIAKDASYSATPHDPDHGALDLEDVMRSFGDGHLDAAAKRQRCAAGDEDTGAGDVSNVLYLRFPHHSVLNG